MRDYNRITANRIRNYSTKVSPANRILDVQLRLFSFVGEVDEFTDSIWSDVRVQNSIAVSIKACDFVGERSKKILCSGDGSVSCDNDEYRDVFERCEVLNERRTGYWLMRIT